MANPTIPHLLGITLDAQGVAKTLVTATNRTTGDKLVLSTDGNKIVVFNAEDFTSGYSANDVIEFTNSGASVGQATITINSATGGFQSTTMDCAAAATVAITL